MTGKDDSCDDAIELDGGAASHQLGVVGFHALWRGERPLVSELTDDAELVGRQVLAGRLEVDESGVLVGVHGLVARNTRHRIEHVGGVVHTWCALDAIGIPAALGIDAVAVTSCPTCDAELRVRVRGGDAMDGEPMRLWLPGGACEHLVDDFCNHANLFCSREHLEAFVPVARPGRALTVAEVAAIGRVTWRDVADDHGWVAGSSTTRRNGTDSVSPVQP